MHLLVIFCLLTVAGQAADWHAQVDEFLDRGFADLANVDVRQQQYSRSEIEDIAASTPSWQALRDYLCRRPLRQIAKPAKFTDCLNYLTGQKAASSNAEVLLLNSITGKDGVTRPWALYLPAGHQMLKPRSLLVVLHGGVSRQNIYENPADVVKESPWLTLARSQGWVLLFPCGQEGATWWDDTGMSNIRQLIRTMKHHVNVDDNRVFLAGFSDGASGGFLHAMLRSDDFAAVVALNGNMGVGSLDGKLPLYAANLAMTPVYAVTTDNDEYYSTTRMAPTIAMARQAGADIFYRQLHGEHDFAYHASEMPLIGRFLRQQCRNPFSNRLYWETGDRNFGACRWLNIAEIGPWPAANWHVDHNCMLTDEEIIWGFSAIRGKEGITIRTVDLVGYAGVIGMRTGDVLLQAGDFKITDSFSLKAAKDSARGGADFAFTVRRDGRKLRLPGTLPQPEIFYLFARTVPSAAIKAEKCDNEVILAGSRLASLQLSIYPEHFDLTRPVQVIYNGVEIFNGIIKPDAAVVLGEYAANRDRKALPAARLSFNFNQP